MNNFMLSWTNWAAVWMVLHSFHFQVTKIDWAPPCWDDDCWVSR